MLVLKKYFDYFIHVYNVFGALRPHHRLLLLQQVPSRCRVFPTELSGGVCVSMGHGYVLAHRQLASSYTSEENAVICFLDDSHSDRGEMESYRSL